MRAAPPPSAEAASSTAGPGSAERPRCACCCWSQCWRRQPRLPAGPCNCSAEVSEADVQWRGGGGSRAGHDAGVGGLARLQDLAAAVLRFQRQMCSGGGESCGSRCWRRRPRSPAGRCSCSAEVSRARTPFECGKRVMWVGRQQVCTEAAACKGGPGRSDWHVGEAKQF
eukprot:364365-Chlamydomonas_euryale.AAC.8